MGIAVYIIAGGEFGELAGRTMIIIMALYGLRTSGARFWEHLAATLHKFGFTSSKADPNMWYRKKGSFYEFIATWVDDVLAWSDDPMAIMEELRKIYTLKGVGFPEYYLGGDVEYMNEHKTKEQINLGFLLEPKNVVQAA